MKVYAKVVFASLCDSGLYWKLKLKKWFMDVYTKVVYAILVFMVN